MRAHEVPEARWNLLRVCEVARDGLEDSPGPGADRMSDELHWLTENLLEATLWFVSPDMTDLVSHAWRDVPPTTLVPELLPDPCGFVVFAHKVVGLAADKAEPLMFDGYVWGPAELKRRDGNLISTVSLAAINHVDGDYWGPMGHTDWAWGTDCDQVTEIEPDERTPLRVASMVEDRRMMATFWLMATQPNIAETSEAPIPRPWRRRAERAGRPVPRVRLIDVRHPRRQPGELHAHRDVEWSHQWIVRGHWRQQAYGPGRTLRRPTWIAPFVKGPDDKPLVVDDVVKVWQR